MSRRAAGGPLEGVRVIELTHAIAGPHAGQMLADHGADVIKVEPPAGDMSRMAEPVVDGGSVYFTSHNRGKRSVCLDLKSPGGQDAFRVLCASADIVLTNYAEDVPARLGFSFETLQEVSPALVLAHVTGFGAEATWAPTSAYDGVIQAMSGTADLTGLADGGPTFVGVFVADHLAANQAVISILMALRERERTGRGSRLAISMLDTYQSMLAHEVGMARLGLPGTRHGNQIVTAFADVFATSDGAVFISPIGEGAWQRFWRVLKMPSVAEQIRFEDAIGDERERLERIVAGWAATRTSDEVCRVLATANVPAGAVASIVEAVTHMASPSRDRLREIAGAEGHRFEVARSPIPCETAEDELSTSVPALGQHTVEVLAPLLSADQLDAVGLAAPSARGDAR